MIVKNEERTLPRLFATLAGQVDYYVVSDTGSTDNTIEVLDQLGQQYGIPGEVHRHEWRSFAHNRNLALEAAVEARKSNRHQCTRVMIMDADEELEVYDPAWKSRLENGRSYYAYRQTENWAMKNSFLYWIEDKQWVWKGDIHNYLVQTGGTVDNGFLSNVAIRYHVFEGAKSHSFKNLQEKASEDIARLELELEGQVASKPNAFRFFQLAFAYKNADHDLEAIDVMRKVINCPGLGSERVFSALIFSASLMIRNDIDSALSWTYLKQAMEIDPTRKEVYYYMSHWYRQKRQGAEALACMRRAYEVEHIDTGAIFLERNIYTWKAAYQLTFLLFGEGQVAEAVQVGEKLIGSYALPDLEKNFVRQLLGRIERARSEGRNPS